MKSTQEGINVKILGKDFLVACPEEQKKSLSEAAGLLDEKMREIQKSGRVIGAERCAIMAALNLAADLIELEHTGGIPIETTNKIRNLQSKIEAVLKN
jgi:cell division protein ZapA